MKRKLSVALVVVTLAGAGDLVGQGAARPCSSPEYHQFDFFAGHWVARKTDGQPAGTNWVSTELGGCMLLEHWTGATGTNGQSLNFYDRNDRKWHQVWVDNEGNWLNLIGALDGKSMNFTATTVGAGGKPQLIKAAFVDTLAGKVREHYESSDDDGSTWKPEFDAIFTNEEAGLNYDGPVPTACGQGPYRQFDFWVGEWKVTTPDGKTAGTSSITREEDGCLIHEHWDGSVAGGAQGQSLNFYDTHDQQWHQQFVGAAGNALHLVGSFQGGRMILTGHNQQSGKPAVQRITWSRNADGSVHQLWQTSLDDGKSWVTSFDGTYRKT